MYNYGILQFIRSSENKDTNKFQRFQEISRVVSALAWDIET